MKTMNLICDDVSICAKSGGGAVAFEVMAYTGSLLNLRGWEAPVVVDLAGLEYSKSLIANLDHDSSQRVGHVNEVKNDGRTLTLKGFLSAATPFRDEVLASYKQGFRWSASIEVNPEILKPVRAGQSATVNGRSFRGPIIITATGTLKGFAFVSHGADAETSVAIAAARRRDAFDDRNEGAGWDRAINKMTNWILR